MKPYITGLLYPQLKSARAGFHLQQLRSMLSAFRDGKPYTVSEHDDHERGEYVVTIALNRADVMIPVFIGEYAYSLRSALDHLAWQLGLLAGRIPSGDSGFPIYGIDSRKNRKSFKRATADMPDEAIQIVERLQPHVRGDRYETHPLWQLNKLCNLDKHVTVGYSHTLISIQVPTEATARESQDTLETEVRLPLALKGERDIYLKKPELIFGRPIEIPGPEFCITEAEIAEIHRYIGQDVLPLFEPFFPGLPTLASLKPTNTPGVT